MGTQGTGELDCVAIAGLVKDGSSTSIHNLRADLATDTLQTMDYEHHEIHAGSHFYFTDARTISAASTDAIDYLIVAPDTTKWAHFIFDADGVAVTSYSLFEDCTKATSDFTAETVFNNDRNSATAATLAIYSAQSSTDGDGTLIYEYAGGASSAQSKTPTEARATRELILKQGKKYIFRVISGTASNLCNILFSWYEHTNVSL